MSGADAISHPPDRPVLLIEVKALTEIANRLADRFPHIPRAQITETVGEMYRRYDDARIRDFVPLLVEREARHQLAHLPNLATA